MQKIEKRALYYLLRINWLNNTLLPVKKWQVEDYCSLSVIQLFKRLENLDIFLNKLNFLVYANECDSPEDLTFHLVGDRELNTDKEDEIYLLIFELWRRLLKEKPSLSILCQNLDEQIYLYDQGELHQSDSLQLALTQLLQILHQNVDQGLSPAQAFQAFTTHCGNNIETFLYDFISEQIEEENELYAFDLLEEVNPYLSDNKWFKLLHIRLSGYPGNKITQKLITELINDHLKEADVEFNLELLSILIERGNSSSFLQVLKESLSLLQIEEQWQDLLSIGIDYFHRSNQEIFKQQLIMILGKRNQIPLQTAFHLHDPSVTQLQEIFAF